MPQNLTNMFELSIIFQGLQYKLLPTQLHFLLTTALRRRPVPRPFLIGEEIRVQSGLVTCPRSHRY